MRLFNLFPIGVLLLSVGCGLKVPSKGDWVYEYEPGNYVAGAFYDARIRDTDLIQVEVVFPSNREGKALSKHPPVVLVQGGLVPTSRYRWLARELASRGYVVAMPNHSLDLAFFTPDNAMAAKEVLLNPDKGSVLDGHVEGDKVAILGHSLGGVVASKLALRGDFFALGLLASYPDSADAAQLPNMQATTLVLAGKKDCRSTLEKVKKDSERLPEPKVLVALEGVTHYQFTDSDKEDIDGNCAPEVPLEIAHSRIAWVSSVFLRNAFLGLGTGKEAIKLLDGAEIQ